MNIEIVKADYHNKSQGEDLLRLLNAYALDPMGGGEPLSEFVQQNLLKTLVQQANVFTLLCYVNNQAAGFINCVDGFSTFNCKPLLNIHDVAVLPEYRGLDLSGKMLNVVEEIAREKGCCKITLEVLEGNKIAQNAYNKAGYAGYELDPIMGRAMFWQKKLL